MGWNERLAAEAHLTPCTSDHSTLFDAKWRLTVRVSESFATAQDFAREFRLYGELPGRPDGFSHAVPTFSVSPPDVKLPIQSVVSTDDV